MAEEQQLPTEEPQRTAEAIKQEAQEGSSVGRCIGRREVHG